MKKNSVLKVVLLTILCAIVCTWIFTSISFSGELVEADRLQVGIFDIFSYLLELFRYFPYVLIYTLAVGIFYGVLYKIPAYRVLLDRIAEKFKGKENIFFITIIVIISALVSVTGLSFAMLFVFPFVISLILLMGYNKLVAASVTVGSVMVGLIGTTVGTSSVQFINYLLDIKTTSEMITKVILLIIGMALLAYHVISYASKTKNDTDKVLDYVPAGSTTKSEIKEIKVEEIKEEKPVVSKQTTTKKKVSNKNKNKKTKANDNASKDVKVIKNKNVSIWPLILVFDLVLILIALGSFDWAGICNAKWPSEVLKAIRDFSIGGFNIFSKLLGDENSLSAFGGWTLNVEMPTIIILGAAFLAFIYGLKFDKFIEGAVEGIKKAIVPAITMLLVYLVLIIVTYHPFQLHIAKFFVTMTKGLNVITMTITAMFASLFNVESTYAAQSTLQYVTSVIKDNTLYPIISVIFQSVYGLMMLIAPTSVILIGTLSYLDIPYTQWIKHIWKLFLELLVVLVIVFLILILI